MTKQLLDNCIACQANVIQHSFAPLQMTTLPQAPWQYLSADFCGPLPSGDMLFVVIDETLVIRKSKLSVLPPRIPSSQSSIVSYLHTEFLPKLKQTTVLHSKVTHSPNFRSTWVSTTVKSPLLGLKLIRSEHSHDERTLNKTLRATHLENKNWQQELFHFLRNYRATPHSTTGVSPAELLFGRELVVKLPELINTAPSRSSISDTDMKQKAKMKAYADTRSKAHPHSLKVGDTVLVREQRKHKLSSPYNKIPYTVTNINGTMITAAMRLATASPEIARSSNKFKYRPPIPWMMTLLRRRRSIYQHPNHLNPQ